MASPLPFSFASVRARTQDHRDIIEMGRTLTTNRASSVGSESAPHFNDVPVVLGLSSHRGERKWQETFHNNAYEWRPQVGGTRGGALTIKIWTISRFVRVILAQGPC